MSLSFYLGATQQSVFLSWIPLFAAVGAAALSNIVAIFLSYRNTKAEILKLKRQETLTRTTEIKLHFADLIAAVRDKPLGLSTPPPLSFHLLELILDPEVASEQKIIEHLRYLFTPSCPPNWTQRLMMLVREWQEGSNP